jgi:hypothetical protein
VEDLPGTREVVEGGDDLLDGRERVGQVDPVEVDVVGLEPPDTVFLAMSGVCAPTDGRTGRPARTRSYACSSTACGTAAGPPETR